ALLEALAASALRRGHSGDRMNPSLAVKSHEVVCRGIVHPGPLKGIWGCQATRSPKEETRMNVHKNARLTPHGRAEVVRRVVELGESARAVARRAHVTEKTVRKWVARVRAGEPVGDRSS